MNPWRIQKISPSPFGILAEGWNEYTQERFIWNLDGHSFKNPGFNARRWWFKGCIFAPGGRVALKKILLQAKHLR